MDNPSPSLRLTLPDGTVLTATVDPDADYPGIFVCLDDALAAVVEWHAVDRVPVLRVYRAPSADDPDGEPVWYSRWDTGESLPT